MAEYEVLLRLLLVRSHVLNGQLSAAATQLKVLSNISPSIAVDAHLLYAGHLLDAGRLDDAMFGYKAVISLNQSHPAGHRGLGITLYRKGGADLSACVAALKQALSLLPSDAVSHSYLSLAYGEAGELALSLEHARLAAVADSTSMFTRFHYGRLLSLKGDWESATREFSASLLLDPTCWQCHVALAEAHSALGDHRAAASDLQIASTLQPSCAEIKCRQGEVMLALGNMNSASALFDAAWLLSQRNRPDVSIATTTQSTRARARHQFPLLPAESQTCGPVDESELAQCWNNAAVACLSLGYMEDGVLWLKEALRIRPSFTTALQNLKLTLDDGVVDRIGIMIASEHASKSKSRQSSPASTQTTKVTVKARRRVDQAGSVGSEDEEDDALETWLGTVVDSLKLIDARHVEEAFASSLLLRGNLSSASASPLHSLDSPAGSFVTSALTTPTSASFDMGGLFGMRRLAAPTPWVWDAAVAALPQQEPVPYDTHLGNTAVKKPPAPPGVTESASTGPSSAEPGGQGSQPDLNHR